MKWKPQRLRKFAMLFNVPFVVVRAISDGGDGKASISFEEFFAIGGEAVFRISVRDDR